MQENMQEKNDKYDEVLFLHIFGKYALPTLLMGAGSSPA
jgi:hypothetical protein